MASVMPLGDYMIKKWLPLTLGFFLFSVFTFAEEGIIDKKMKAALRESNPQFATWGTQDYSPTVQRDALERNRPPYALILDVNEDKKNDVVLDGHDKENNLLICLLSSTKGYEVIIIRRTALLNPKELENLNDGVKEMGLNYFLWPIKKGTGFTLAYPQQSDSDGHLLNDVAMIDYIFKDGEFHESYQTL
jgi:hypothetical protein